MIPIFYKLQRENLLKQNGVLLDLGCGNGRQSEPFYKYGYRVILVDKDGAVLEQAKNNLSAIREGKMDVQNLSIEDFDFKESYDGVIISNVLPFQTNKENIDRIVRTSFEKLNKGGFLFFTLFGHQDAWDKEYPDRMSFYDKDEALNILPQKPYFIS